MACSLYPDQTYSGFLSFYWLGDRLKAEVALHARCMSDGSTWKSFSGFGYSLLLRRSYGLVDSASSALTIQSLIESYKALGASPSLLPREILAQPSFVDLYVQYVLDKVGRSDPSSSVLEMMSRFIYLLSIRFPGRPDLPAHLLAHPLLSGHVLHARMLKRLIPTHLYASSQPLLRLFSNYWDLSQYQDCLLGYWSYLLLPRADIKSDFCLRTYSLIGETQRLSDLFALYLGAYPHGGLPTSLLSSYLFTLLGEQSLSMPACQEAISQLGSCFASSESDGNLAKTSEQSPPLSICERPLLVVISPDLRDHPVGRFWLPIALGISDSFRLIHISIAPKVFQDHVSKLLQECSEEWFDLSCSDSPSLDQLLRQLKPDIALDLAGHTADNQVSWLHHRYATVQLSYLGFYGPTYASQCDWWIVDKYVGRRIENSYPNAEPLWQLPFPSLCYGISVHGQPQLESLRMSASRYGAIGCFNHTRKLSPTFLVRLGSVMAANPDVPLHIRSHSFSDPFVRRRVLQRLIDAGVSCEQINVLPFAPTATDSLSDYNRIALHLDSYPVSGTTTTLDSLVMGVPVLTSPNSLYAGAISAGLLEGLGLSDFIVVHAAELPSRASFLLSHYQKPEARIDLARHVRSSLMCNPFEFSKLFAGELSSMLKAKIG